MEYDTLALSIHGNDNGGTLFRYPLEADEHIIGITAGSSNYWNNRSFRYLAFYTDKDRTFEAGHRTGHRTDDNYVECSIKFEEGYGLTYIWGSIAYHNPGRNDLECILLSSIGGCAQAYTSSSSPSIEELRNQFAEIFPDYHKSLLEAQTEEQFEEIFNSIIKTEKNRPYSDIPPTVWTTAASSSACVASPTGESGSICFTTNFISAMPTASIASDDLANENNDYNIFLQKPLYERLTNASGKDIEIELIKLLEQLVNLQKSDKLTSEETAKMLAAGVVVVVPGTLAVVYIGKLLAGELALPAALSTISIYGFVAAIAAAIAAVLAILIPVIYFMKKNASCCLLFINELAENVTVDTDFINGNKKSIIRPKTIYRQAFNGKEPIFCAGLFFTERNKGNFSGLSYGVSFLTTSNQSFSLGMQCPLIQDNNCACSFTHTAEEIADFSGSRCGGDQIESSGKYTLSIKRSSPSGSAAYFIASIKSNPSTINPVDRKDWMASLSETLLISDINIPGSHDAAAINPDIHTLYACHKASITQQLEGGIRLFDIRLKIKMESNKYEFCTCHGDWMGGNLPINEFQSFRSLIDEMEQFLKVHSTEALIMTLKIDDWGVCKKDESKRQDALEALSNILDDSIFIKSACIPQLKDNRGKIYLMNRIDETLRFGSPIQFPNNTNGEYINISDPKTRNYPFYVQDKFKTDDKEKNYLVKQIFDMEKVSGTVYFNYASGTKYLIRGIYILGNLMLYFGKDIANKRKTKLGWLMMDYEFDLYNTDQYNYLSMVDLYISSNFNYSEYPDKFSLIYESKIDKSEGEI